MDELTRSQIFRRDAFAELTVDARRSIEVWIQIRHALALQGSSAARRCNRQRRARPVREDARELPASSHSTHQQVVPTNSTLAERNPAHPRQAERLRHPNR